MHSNNNLFYRAIKVGQSAGAVEYNDFISAEG